MAAPARPFNDCVGVPHGIVEQLVHGPIVAQTMLPKAYICSRLPAGARSDPAALVNEGLGDVADRIDDFALSRTQTLDDASGVAAKRFGHVRQGPRESAFATTARTRECLGGSSVSKSSGRTEFGSCQGREVDEKLLQSLRPAATCSWRASMVMFSAEA